MTRLGTLLSPFFPKPFFSEFDFHRVSPAFLKDSFGVDNPRGTVHPVYFDHRDNGNDRFVPQQKGDDSNPDHSETFSDSLGSPSPPTVPTSGSF